MSNQPFARINSLQRRMLPTFLEVRRLGTLHFLRRTVIVATLGALYFIFQQSAALKSFQFQNSIAAAWATFLGLGAEASPCNRSTGLIPGASWP